LVFRSLRVCAVLLCLVVALVAAPAALAGTTTIDLMPGVTYTRETRTIEGKPVVVHVVTAPKPGGKLYRLAPVLSDGEVAGRQTLTAMQKGLSKAATAVGVNGDLFSYTTDSSSGILMRDGVLISRPVAKRSSLGISAEGLLSIGRIGFYGRWALGEAKRRPLAQFNRPLEGRGVALFTPVWGSATPVVKKAVDVVLSGVPPATVGVDLPGQVVSVSEGGGTPIPKGGAVLQAVGPIAAELRSTAIPGTPFVARLDLKPWWEGVADAIGGGPALIQDGKIVLPTTEEFTPNQLSPRYPRSAVGQLGDGRVVLVAIDGGQPWSAGVDVRGLADELLRLGVVNGMALDAGGSTTLAFDGAVLNTPSAGSERALSNALMLLYYGVFAPMPSQPVVSPNGDGVAEQEQLAYKVVRPSTVRARLIGPNGKVVWTEKQQREPGTYPFQVAREAFKQGRWRWVVNATDADGVKSKIERTFTVNNTLGFLQLSSPTVKVGKKRGGSLGISFKVANRARVVVTVQDRGRVVRTLLSRRKAPGTVQLTWDTRAEGGQIVVPGRYDVVVEARNKFGVVELSRPVDVRRGK
jgi:hypothetical protein